MTPFDFLNAINESKKDLIKEDPSNEKEYSAWMVNRGLSFFSDTVMYANEMNQRHQISNKWQFQFLLNSIPKKKRFSKWFKREEEKHLKLVMDCYGYSSEKAKQVLTILTPEQLKTIEEKQYTGGRK
jgi:hypothetical protein